MHLRLPSDVPSRALRRKAHRAPASGEGLVAPDQRPCLLGVGFPSSGPRVWTFTSFLWVMPLAPAARAPCGCLVADVPAFRVRVTPPFAHVPRTSPATPPRSPASLRPLRRRDAPSRAARRRLLPRAVLAPSLQQPLSPPFHIHRHTLDFARVTPTTPSRVRRTRTRVRSSSGV